MNKLSEFLDDMDASEEEDAWMDAVFEGARQHGFLTDEEEAWVCVT
jgi:hypothetical protein